MPLSIYNPLSLSLLDKKSLSDSIVHYTVEGVKEDMKRNWNKRAAKAELDSHK